MKGDKGARGSDLFPPRRHLFTYLIFPCMSRAFVNEDAGSGDALGKYPFPDRGDPAFTLAAARGCCVAPIRAIRWAPRPRQASTGAILRWSVRSPIAGRGARRGERRMAQLAGRYLRRMQRSK